MTSAFSVLIAILIAVAGFVINVLVAMATGSTSQWIFFVAIAIAVIVAFSVKVAAQWERGVILRLGKFHGLKGPGVLLVFPVVDHVQFVDTRLLTLDVPGQQVITRDNVPVAVDGVVFFTVRDPGREVTTVPQKSKRLKR